MEVGEACACATPGSTCWPRCVVTSVLVAAPLALGAGEGQPIDGGARNPSNNASQAYTRRRRSSPTCRRTARASPTSPTTAVERSTAVARRTRGGTRACARRTWPTARRSRSTPTAATGRQHHVVQQERRAVHDERDRRRHRPERRPGRRPERVADPDRGVDRGRHVGEQVRRHQRRHRRRSPPGAASTSTAHTSTGVYTVTCGREHQRVRVRRDAAERDVGDRDGRPRRRDAPAACGRSWTRRGRHRRARRRRRERAPDHHLLRQVNGIAGARGCAPAPTRP